MHHCLLAAPFLKEEQQHNCIYLQQPIKHTGNCSLTVGEPIFQNIARTTNAVQCHTYLSWIQVPNFQNCNQYDPILNKIALFSICASQKTLVVFCVWLRAFVASVLIALAANCAVYASCAKAQPKNSTFAQAVHVDIKIVSQLHKCCACTAQKSAQFGRKHSTSMLAMLAAFCIWLTDWLMKWFMQQVWFFSWWFQRLGLAIIFKDKGQFWIICVTIVHCALSPPDLLLYFEALSHLQMAKLSTTATLTCVLQPTSFILKRAPIAYLPSHRLTQVRIQSDISRKWICDCFLSQIIVG